MVSMIPEQEIFLDTFASIASASGGNRTITLNATFTGNFNLVENLYVGCVLEIYKDSDDSFTDKTVVVSNTGTTITVSDTLASAITTTASDYYGVLRQFGSPVPAPSPTGSGSLSSVSISNAGTQVTANLAILDNTEINAVSGISGGSNGEIELTLSAHTTVLTFATATATNYEDNDAGEDGFFTLSIAGTDATETVAVIFNDDDQSAKSTGADRDITVDIDTTGSNFDDGSTIAEAVRLALASEDLTITRAANVLTITNSIGGYVADTTEDTGGGVTVTSNTAGGVVTAVTINNTGSGFSGSGTATITTGGTNAEIAITVSTAGSPKLLSDTWIGLADSITVPTTSVEMKQLNLASAGTRNYIYQFKGAESTDGGSINLFANNFTFLYYALGNKAIGAVGNEASVTLSSEHATSGLSGTNFIFDDTSSDTTDRFYRVEGNTVCPPIRKGVDDLTGVKKVGTAASDFITYTYTEENGEELPSFALEYTLKKGSQNATTAVDSAKEAVYTKIYPGCQVNTMTITADEGQEIKTDISLMTKTTVIAPTSYETFNGLTNVQDFVNYGSRTGGVANQNEGLMTPYFFSGGTIEMFGNEYIRIQNCTLTINNGLQDKRFIGRTNKRIKSMVTGQRTYELQFTGLVTDAAIFDELRNDSSTALTGTASLLKLNFYKTNGEQVQLHFRDYMVKSADFPLTNDNSPITVTWTIEPLVLETAQETTYWVIQG